MTNTEILNAMTAVVEALDLPVKVALRTRANYKGQLDAEPSEIFVTADAFGNAGLHIVATVRDALIDWYVEHRDNFADRKLVNVRGRENKIFRFTYCDRYPEHAFFSLRIEAR